LLEIVIPEAERSAAARNPWTRASGIWIPGPPSLATSRN